ncbi:MAG: hypothetical protein NTU54_06205 [Candidatus Omnitrophica bacterium]|nr:hypothetical protein [Candidatus Omnitrophota bacterium]
MKKKAILLILGILLSLCLISALNMSGYLFISGWGNGRFLGARIRAYPKNAFITDTLRLLKLRKDNAAYLNSEQILNLEPYNIDALWIKAEVLRRKNNYKNSEELLRNILNDDPEHNPSLISLAYIEYNANKFDEAQRLIQRVLKSKDLEREEQALAFMMLGAINSGRAQSGGWIFNKFRYGTKIKGYFLKAREIAPDLPEVHLALGTFYLYAPALVGGNLNKAISELERAVSIAPEFATAYARLAQAYKAKNDMAKYNLFLNKAKKLDPQDETVKKAEDDKH